MKKHIILITLLIIVSFIPILTFNIVFNFKTDGKTEISSIKKIKKKGKLSVITMNNIHGYYIYRGMPMGFEYDLVKAFADEIGVRLEVKVVKDYDAMIPALIAGEGDIIAAGMTKTQNRQKRVRFCKSYMDIRYNLITNRSRPKIRNIEDLDGKTIFVGAELQNEDNLLSFLYKDADFRIKILNDTQTSGLIKRVAEGVLDITVANSNIALLNRKYYPQSVISIPVSDKICMAWAVNRGENDLAETIDSFFAEIKQNGRFNRIYNQYFEDVDSFDYVDIAIFHRRLKTRLPRYKKIIKDAAEKRGFDWRLIAAQTYQESHFKPYAKSPAKAYGLMQLTRGTAKSLGVSKIYDPFQNINAGVKYLQSLYKLYDKYEGIDRIYTALSAYNIGQGHIYDARMLAKKMGKDPNKWFSLTKTLPLLSQKKYYNDSVYGFCKGSEPLRYVKQIMIYYNILKHKYVKDALLVLTSDKQDVLPVSKSVLNKPLSSNIMSYPDFNYTKNNQVY